MAIKTFDANRVGGGTFQLEQDSLTGEYKLKEVGFVKLPELKLPEIEQAAPATITPNDPTTDTPVDVGGVQTSNEGSGGGGGQQDFTGTSMLKNIQEEATKFSKQDTQSGTFGGQPTFTTTPGTKVDNATGNITNPDGSYGGNIVDEVTLTGRQPDRIMEKTSEFGSLSIPKDKNVIDVAKDLISNSITVKVVTTGAQAVGSMLKSVGEAVFGPETNSQVHAKGYFNLAGGTGSQVQRIGGNPATDLYAGANRNARELDDYGQKRIDTIEKNLAAGKYRDPKKQREKLEKFKKDQKEYRESRNEDMRDREEAALSDKTKSVDYGITGGATRTDIDVGDGGSESSGGGKIVCTMMNESYGFGSFRNKIWMKFHKDLSPEYQKGYHKLFLPLIKIAKTNKIVKNILEHIAVHSTIDMRQSMRGKKHLLGRLYRKILLPLCYWAGKI